MAWLRKTPDASDDDMRKLASQTRDAAAEIEIDAIDKPKAQQEEAAARARAIRERADTMDPDVKS